MPPIQPASVLANALKDGLNIEVSHKFRAAFVVHSRYLPSDLHEDFASFVLLECYETQEKGVSLDDHELLRILDRVRHRIARTVRSHRGVSGVACKTAPGEASPEQLSRIVRQFTESLSERESVVFMHYLDGLTPNQISRALRLSPATTYRSMADIRHKFTEFVGQLGLEE